MSTLNKKYRCKKERRKLIKKKLEENKSQLG